MGHKTATEDMEITEIDESRSYETLAESHGARYRSGVRVEPIHDDRSTVTFTFSGEPLTFGAKVMNAVMGWLFTGATRKAIEADLADIAAAAEAEAAG